MIGQKYKTRGGHQAIITFDSLEGELQGVILEYNELRIVYWNADLNHKSAKDYDLVEKIREKDSY